MPKTKEQIEIFRQERKAYISHVALELFANNGYFNTSIAQIAKAANISKGLLYNYFKNKEDLLLTLILEIMHKVMMQINPNNDDEIDDEEAEVFIDNLFKVLTDNPKDWKLYYQLMMQQNVFDFVLSDELQQQFLRYQSILFNYFKDREFEDPLVAMLHFSSVYKGFALQYVFAPEMFNAKVLDRFKKQLAELFIRPKRKTPISMELDKELGYLLM